MAAAPAPQPPPALDRLQQMGYYNAPAVRAGVDALMRAYGGAYWVQEAPPLAPGAWKEQVAAAGHLAPGRQLVVAHLSMRTRHSDGVEYFTPIKIFLPLAFDGAAPTVALNNAVAADSPVVLNHQWAAAGLPPHWPQVDVCTGLVRTSCLPWQQLLDGRAPVAGGAGGVGGSAQSSGDRLVALVGFLQRYFSSAPGIPGFLQPPPHAPFIRATPDTLKLLQGAQAAAARGMAWVPPPPQLQPQQPYLLPQQHAGFYQPQQQPQQPQQLGGGGGGGGYAGARPPFAQPQPQQQQQQAQQQAQQNWAAAGLPPGYPRPALQQQYGAGGAGGGGGMYGAGAGVPAYGASAGAPAYGAGVGVGYPYQIQPQLQPQQQQGQQQQQAQPYPQQQQQQQQQAQQYLQGGAAAYNAASSYQQPAPAFGMPFGGPAAGHGHGSLPGLGPGPAPAPRDDGSASLRAQRLPPLLAEELVQAVQQSVESCTGYARAREGAARRGAAFSALIAAHEARLAELDLYLRAADEEEREVAAWLEAAAKARAAREDERRREAAGDGADGGGGGVGGGGGGGAGMGLRRGSAARLGLDGLPAPCEAEETVAAQSEAGAELLRCIAADRAIADTLGLIRDATGPVGAASLVQDVKRRAKEQFEARARARRLVAEMRAEAAAAQAGQAAPPGAAGGWR